mgnify:CR=1 FL=1
MKLKRYFCVILCILLSACAALPRAPKPLLKIGLVAPFEGRDRALGYQALEAVKEALAQRNAAGGVGGYMIELVALNDNNIAEESAFQARKFAVDADVMGVIGPFSEAALAAAAPYYDEFGLPLIAPVATDGQPHPAVFSLAASPAELAIALLERLPHENDPLLIDSGGTLGAALRPAIRRVVSASGDPAELARRVHLSTERPPSHILFDGNAQTAAEFLVALRAVGGQQPVLGGPDLARTQLPQIAGAAAQNVCYAIAVPTPSAYTASTTPAPWGELACTATNLLLDTLEQVLQSEQTPSRRRVLAQLNATFESYRRERIGIQIYCYNQDK